MTSQTRKSFAPSSGTNDTNGDQQSDPFSGYLGLNYAQQAALLWANAAAVAAAASTTSSSSSPPFPSDIMAGARISKTPSSSMCPSSSGNSNFDLPQPEHSTSFLVQPKHSQRSVAAAKACTDEQCSLPSTSAYTNNTSSSARTDPSALMMSNLISSSSHDFGFGLSGLGPADPSSFKQQSTSRKADSKYSSDLASVTTTTSETAWVTQFLQSLAGAPMSYLMKQQQHQQHQQQQQQQQQQAALLLAAALSREAGFSGFPASYLEQFTSVNADRATTSRSECAPSSSSASSSVTAGAATNLAYAQAMMMAMAAACSSVKTPPAPSGIPPMPPLTSSSTASNYEFFPFGPFGSGSATSSGSSMTGGEPAESFNDVLSFLTRCLNAPKSMNDRLSGNQHGGTDPKASLHSTGPTHRRNLRGASNSRSRGANGITSCSAVTSWEQPAAAIPARHRGRGRPPKSTTISIPYSTHAKQSTQSGPSSSQARFSDESDIYLQQTNDSATASAGRRSSATVSSVESSIEETIDEVLRHLAACDYDPAVVATKHASSVLGMALNRKRRKDLTFSLTQSSDPQTADSLSDVTGSHIGHGECFTFHGTKRPRAGPSAESGLRLPLALGWRRETLVKGIGPGGILGEVIYVSPCGRRLWNLESVREYLKSNNVNMLSVDDFSFKSYIRLGDYYECNRASQSPQSYVKMSESALDSLTSSAGLSETMDVSSLANCSWSTSAYSDGKADIHLNTPEVNLPRGSRRTSSGSLDTSQASCSSLMPPAAHSHPISAQKSTFQFPSSLFDLPNADMNLNPYLTHGLNMESLTVPPAAHIVNDCSIRTSVPQLPVLDSGFSSSGPNPFVPPNLLCGTITSDVPTVENPWSSLKRPVSLLNSTQFTAGNLGLTGLEPAKERDYMKNFFVQLANEHLRLDLEERTQRQNALLEEREQILTLCTKERVEHELKKPVEDLRLLNSKALPDLEPLPGNRLSSQAFADCLLLVEFLHAFTEILCIDSETIPTLGMLQSGLVDRDPECQQAILHLLVELLKFAILDPGLPSSRLVTQLLGQRFSELEVNASTVTGLLRVFLIGRNGFEDEMSDWLLPPCHFTDLSADQQAALLAFVCDELVCSSRLISTEVDRTIELQAILRREKWVLESKIRRLRFAINRKISTGNNDTGTTEFRGARSTLDTSSNSLELHGTHDEYSLSPGSRTDDTGEQWSNLPKRASLVPTRSQTDRVNLYCNEPVDIQEGNDKQFSSLSSGSAAPNASAAATAAVSAAAVASAFLSGDEEDSEDSGQIEAKIETLNQVIEYKQRAIDECAYRLSGLFLGQDRYYRRYYALGHMGGIYVQGSHTVQHVSGYDPTTNAPDRQVRPTDLCFGFDPDHLVAEIHERRQLAERRRYTINIPTSSSSSHHHSHHASSENLAIPSYTGKSDDSAAILCTPTDIDRTEKEELTTVSSYCTKPEEQTLQLGPTNTVTDVKQDYSPTSNKSTKLIDAKEAEDEHNSPEMADGTDRCTDFDPDKSPVPEVFGCDLGASLNHECVMNADFTVSNVQNKPTLSQNGNTSSDCLPEEEVSTLTSTHTSGDIAHSFTTPSSVTFEPPAKLRESDRLFLPLKTDEIPLSSPSEKMEERIKIYTPTDPLSTKKPDPYAYTFDSDKSTEDESDEELKTKLESDIDLPKCSATSTKSFGDSKQVRGVKFDSDQCLSYNSGSRDNPTTEACEESLGMSQPLDLSTRASGELGPVVKQAHDSLSQPCPMLGSEHEFLDKLGFDDVLLTTAALLFMTHTSIIPASVACSESLSDPWKSIIAHYKSIIIWALMEEFSSTMDLTSEAIKSDPSPIRCAEVSNSTLSPSRPLHSSIFVLKEFFLRDPARSKCTKDPSGRILNVSDSANSGDERMAPVSDSEVEELVNRELQVRNIQLPQAPTPKMLESNLSEWCTLTTAKRLKEFMGCLASRGIRERNLFKSIERSEGFVNHSLPVATKIISEFGDPDQVDEHGPRFLRVRSRRGKGRGNNATNQQFFTNMSRSESCVQSADLSPGDILGNGDLSSCVGLNGEPLYPCATHAHEGLDVSEDRISMASENSCADLNPSLVLEHRLRRRPNQSSLNKNENCGSVTERLEKRPGVSGFKAQALQPNGRSLHEVMGSGDPVFVAECCFLEEVEALEDRVLHASLQVKGWQAPMKVLDDETIHLIPRATPKRSRFEHWPLDLAKIRLLGLESHLERRYLLPPLNSEVHLNVVSEPESSMAPDPCRNSADLTDQETESESGFGGGPGSESTTTSLRDGDVVHHQPVIRRIVSRQSSTQELSTSSFSYSGLSNYHNADMQDATNYWLGNCTTTEQVPPGLVDWRHRLHRATELSAMRACMDELVAAIAWEKSIMKVLCQICRRDNNEAQLLLCDGCDHGYHTYCFRPPLINIPPGDWFCHDCVSKATGRAVCFICGLVKPSPITSPGLSIAGSENAQRLLSCDNCARAVHGQCARPPMTRIPRRWFCANCVTGSGKVCKSGGAVPVDAATPSPSGSAGRIVKKVDNITDVDSATFSLISKETKRKSTTSTSGPTSEPTFNRASHSLISNLKFTASSNTKRLSNSRSIRSGLLGKMKRKSQNRAHLPPHRGIQKKSGTMSKSLDHKRSAQRPDRPGRSRASLNSTECNTEVRSNASKPRLIGDDDSFDNGSQPYSQESISCSEEERSQNSPLSQGLLDWIRTATEDLINHEASWAFRKPVNVKQVPFYRKIIKHPMDLSTIYRKTGHPCAYSSIEQWRKDVRLIFNNCEIFNEDESEVGRAGHTMRAYFESHWSNPPRSLCDDKSEDATIVLHSVSKPTHAQSPRGHPDQQENSPSSDIILADLIRQRSSGLKNETADVAPLSEDKIRDHCYPKSELSKVLVSEPSPSRSVDSDSRSSGFSGFEQNEYMLGLQLTDLDSPAHGVMEPERPFTPSATNHPSMTSSSLPSEVCLPVTSSPLQ